MAYINVPVGKLTLSTRYQARKTPGQQPISELAESIHAQGLLQNLVVVKGKKGMYEVVAGGRRLQALQCLLKDGRWPEDQTVPALLVAGEVAFEASITENVQRENMHPADEFEAFNSLLQGGKTVEYVAARFGVTPVYVQRRMKMAMLAPELIAAYREGEMTLDMLTAFTVSDDKEAQLKVWLTLPSWQQTAQGIKNMLRREAITAKHRWVKFVGLDAYTDAGGTITRDLFNESDEGIYIEQPELLEKLVIAKLETFAEQYRQEGWGWVEVRGKYDYEEWDAYGRIYPTKGELSAEQKTELQALYAQHKEAEDRLINFEAETEGDDSEEIVEKWNELSEAVGIVESKIENLETEAPDAWPEGMQAVAGVLLTVSYDGDVSAQLGLIKREDRDEAKKMAEDGDTEGSVSLPNHSRRPTHSEKLVRQLTANKTAIVQAALARSTNVALAVLVARLATDHFGGAHEGYRNGWFGLGITTSPENLHSAAPDLESNRAGRELAQLHQEWLEKLPRNKKGGLGDVLQWALQQDTDTLLSLQAYLVAITVQGIQSQETEKATPVDKLAGLLGIRIDEWWSATAETYLTHVPKARILEVASDAVGAEAAEPLQKMKKSEAAKAAEQLLNGGQWLPEIMKLKEVNEA